MTFLIFCSACGDTKRERARRRRFVVLVDWVQAKADGRVGKRLSNSVVTHPTPLFQPQPRPLQNPPLNAWSRVSWHYAGSRLVLFDLLVSLALLLRERRLLLR